MATKLQVLPDGDQYYYCTECDSVLDGEVMCDCQEYVRPKAQSKSLFSVTCDDCGYSGSIERVQLHSCAIQRSGGRCEDYPCCGHTDGDGCQTLPSHTAAFWSDMMRRDPDWYDMMDQNGWEGVTFV